MDEIYQKVEEICKDLQRMRADYEKSNEEWRQMLDNMTARLEEQNKKIEVLDNALKSYVS